MTCSRALAVLALTLFLTVSATHGAGKITVDEGRMRIDIGAKPALKLPVTNTTGQAVSTPIELEFLDTVDRSPLKLRPALTIASGASVLDIPLPKFLELEDAHAAHYGWLRLKYKLGDDAAGIVSVSQIAPEPFVLTVARRYYAPAATGIRLQVLALNPTTGKPVPKVQITARVMPEKDTAHAVVRNAQTDSSGFADVELDQGKLGPHNDFDLEIEGRLGNFVRRVTDSVNTFDPFQIITTTDKPIYQPGQKLRVRLLALTDFSGAAKGKPVTVVIGDLGGDQVLEAPLTTSSYGEAHLEWTIPENARTGPYEIRINSGIARRGGATVWVGPYDLPNFTVDVRRDRPYYLPRQRPEIDVHAEYLFGKDVPGAHIRIARETNRSWNYREEKWDIEQGDAIEGTADSSGRFHVTLNLEEDFEGLSDRHGSEYRDIDWTAYVTDPSTNRTEESRFVTRITRYPIHIYAFNTYQAVGLPMEFFVTASYADGNPAVCDIELFDVLEDARIPLTTIRTNKYGVAKVSGLPLPPAFFQEGWRQQIDIELLARDATGKTGQQRNHLYVSDEEMRVYTNKNFYRANEPIDVRVESTSSSALVVLNVVHGAEVTHSSVLQLSGGKASARIPYTKAFAGAVAVIAYDPARVNYLQAKRQILFPGSEDFHIEVTAGKPAYAPGEEATLRFRLRNNDGSPRSGLIGITVLDKAVEQRAQANSAANLRLCCLAGFDRDFWDSEVGGLTRADLDRVDRSRPIDADLELTAELMLIRSVSAFGLFDTAGHEQLVSRSFPMDLQNRFDARKKAGGSYPSGRALPTDEPALRTMVHQLDPDFGSLRDPWDMPYRLKSSFVGNWNEIKVLSSGPDKRLETADDFIAARLSWDYFAEYSALLNAALVRHHKRTDGYVRDLETLKAELSLDGQDFDTWRDPHGGMYSAEFYVDGPRFAVMVRTDRSVAWTGRTDYTFELREQINSALDAFVNREKKMPETESAFKDALARAGVSETQLRDPWGRAYYTVIKTESGYLDDVTILSKTETVTNVVPVSQELRNIRLRSAGRDGVEGTPDDFSVVTISRPVGVQTAAALQPRTVGAPASSDATGHLFGVVSDPGGAVLPGVSVKVSNSDGVYQASLTNDSGEFSFRLKPGNYQLRIDFPSFVSKTLDVSIRPDAFTRVIAVLEVSDVIQTMQVNAIRIPTFTPIMGLEPLATPRLREYFPETLFWQPALETSGNGTAEARFKLADSITTWKARVIASTKDGKVALADADIKAFQPFFVEHDPPKFLTQGDRIALPVVVRNYLDHDQSLDVSMKPENWFAALDAPSKKASLGANESSRQVFAFEAKTPIKNGAQQITALGSTASDAIVKTSTVLPFGREMTQVSSEILRTSTEQTVTIPPNALPGSFHAEIKIYPNLMSHVVDGIEAIMRRPHGCLEQVISSAYPSLLYLRYAKTAGSKQDAQSETATKYLRAAVQMLRGYRTESGGFSYWSRGDADPAVTAYAVEFLTGAKEFIAIDDELVSNAILWLINDQRVDGSWRGELGTTAHVARVLSMPGIRRPDNDRVPAALAYLQKNLLQPPAPYVTASMALTALNIGDKKLTDEALATLKTQARSEGGVLFWDLQTNTPFYSWGLPGRLETTALVIRALTAGHADPALIDKGLLFLLKNKDEFGVWHSTQATVRVLEVLADAVAGPQERGRRSAGAAQIRINGVSAATIAFGGGAQPNSPVTLDIARFLTSGANRVEIIANGKAAAATVQLVESHYVPWDSSAGELATGPLRFAVRFDKREGAIGDAIRVNVNAERVGFRGYGMMIAEIGLPPGADVDRASLELASEKSGWDLQHYDILPDRIIVYLWPRAGGTSFEFQFRSRFGLDAHAPASKLYDYYNPDANVLLLPERFVVGTGW